MKESDNLARVEATVLLHDLVPQLKNLALVLIWLPTAAKSRSALASHQPDVHLERCDANPHTDGFAGALETRDLLCDPALFDVIQPIPLPLNLANFYGDHCHQPFHTSDADACPHHEMTESPARPEAQPDPARRP